MAAGPFERKLAAILAADVVGYSRLMGEDEAGTHARLKALREDFFEPRIGEYRGRIVKLTGDGALVDFASVVDAVQCAIEVQESIALHNADLEPEQRLEFRIGINLGDVIIDGDDIYGDGVNVAARLEGLAPPGGVCVSDVVHQMVRGRLDLAFTDLGEQQVKNIAQLVRVWRWGSDDRATGPPKAGGATPPTLPNKPSIAVLPFGPSAGEYLAWVYHGGGQQLWREILVPHGIYSVFCSLEAPEASGWFREEITSVDDLKGLKMRFLGLGALTMQKLGVSTQLLPPADVYPALERGVIDATELSVPAVDLKLGFHEIAKHYYFPGWHQPATLVDLMIHLPRWQELSDTHQAQIEVACRASIVDNLALAEALQFGALKELQARGVQLHRWPPEMLAAFEAAWQEVAAEQAAEDADFKRAWDSLQAFRADYKSWKDLGYLD